MTRNVSGVATLLINIYLLLNSLPLFIQPLKNGCILQPTWG